MNDDELVTKFLSGIVTEKRFERIEEKIAQRTRYLTIVMEDIYQSQNASAVLRTCECFGIQDVHIIENYNTYKINPMVLKGADKWLTVYRHNQSENNSVEAVCWLKSKGYRIVATSLNEDSVDLENFDINRGKCAIIFGNEHQGVSDYLMAQADECLKVPMRGFTQSLNISVAAGVIVSQLTQRIRDCAVDWKLTDAEYRKLRLEWLKCSVKNPQMLIEHFENENKNS